MLSIAEVRYWFEVLYDSILSPIPWDAFIVCLSWTFLNSLDCKEFEVFEWFGKKVVVIRDKVGRIIRKCS